MADRRRRDPKQEQHKKADKPGGGEERRHGERRKDERVAAEVMVEVETSGRRTYRRTANISMGGVGFHQPIPFRKGAHINLTLRLAGQKKAVQVEGEVVGSDASGRGTRVRFGTLSTKAHDMLKSHLELFAMPTQIGPQAGPPATARKAPKERVREGILIVEGLEEGQEHRVRSTDKIIGRDPRTADFVINHPSVSRRHAHIYLHNDRHVIADLSSTNGVHFRNKPIHTLVLKDGMVFRIGKVKVQYLVTRQV